jgi:hypothetical protein
MLKRFALSLALAGFLVGTSGCLSLNFDENVRQINSYGKDLDDLRKLTNKYFWNYDQDDPFAD